MIITIDGPAGSGKSTVARGVAEPLGFAVLNSGLIYRAVTMLVIERGGRFDDRELVQYVLDNADLRFQEQLVPEDSVTGGSVTGGSVTGGSVTGGSAPRSPTAEASGPRVGRTRVYSGSRDITARLKDPEVTAQVFRIANDGAYRLALVDLQRRFARPRPGAPEPGLVAEGRDMGSVIFPGADYKFYLDASPEERARRQFRELQAAGTPTTYDEVHSALLRRDRHDREREHAPLVVPEGALTVHTDGMSIAEVTEKLLAVVRAGLTVQGAGSEALREEDVPRRH
jgi:cytidylate kinase